MLKKTTLFLSFALCFANISNAQSTNYGTYTIYKNPKRVQVFTNEKFEEIQQTIEEKRADYIKVVWEISEYTYVIIEPRYKIREQINTLEQ